MKNLNQIGLILFIAITAFNANYAQDSLSAQLLKPVSHTFIIENNQLVGPGAEFIYEKLSKAQYTQLGEYHYSKNISEFTEALIPKLHGWGCRHMLLEVGPNTGEYLDNLPEDKELVVSNLKSTNQKYLLDYDGDFKIPIPFFDMEEDALFLGEAKDKGWNIIGIDQEYWYGMRMQIDWMYENLDSKKQSILREKHNAVKDTLESMHDEDTKKRTPLFYNIKKSTFITEYIDEMAQEPKNTDLVDAFRKCVDIYALNDTGQWFENNDTRVKYMKERLREGLESNDFDISKDKLVIKMGALHLSQGFSRSGFYEVGNMLTELAAYHGNSSVNIKFINRYEILDDGTLEDILDTEYTYYKNLKSFYGLGSETEWIVLDLKEIRESYTYSPVKYRLNEFEKKFVQSYDLLIITPTEYPRTNNF